MRGSGFLPETGRFAMVNSAQEWLPGVTLRRSCQAGRRNSSRGPWSAATSDCSRSRHDHPQPALLHTERRRQAPRPFAVQLERLKAELRTVICGCRSRNRSAFWLLAAGLKMTLFSFPCVPCEVIRELREWTLIVLLREKWLNPTAEASERTARDGLRWIFLRCVCIIHRKQCSPRF